MINIVQFGANTGNDHVTKLINEIIIPNGKDFHLYLVEPIVHCIKDLLENYKHIKNVTLERSAIVPSLNSIDQDGKVEIFYGKDTNYAVSSLYKDHVKNCSTSTNNNPVSINKLLVKGYTPEQLFEKWGLKNIDYLFIDIEGLDNEVIQGINYINRDINFMCWEHTHIYEEKETVGKRSSLLKSYENLWRHKFTIERVGNESYAYKRTKNESYISDIRQWL